MAEVGSLLTARSSGVGGTSTADLDNTFADGFTHWSIKDHGTRRAAEFDDLDKLVEKCVTAD